MWIPREIDPTELVNARRFHHADVLALTEKILDATDSEHADLALQALAHAIWFSVDRNNRNGTRKDEMRETVNSILLAAGKQAVWLPSRKH